MNNPPYTRFDNSFRPSVATPYARVNVPPQPRPTRPCDAIREGFEMGGKKVEPLAVVHRDCAGIDVGKRKHYVAVDPSLPVEANALALNRALIRSAQGQDAGVAHLAFVFTHEPPATTLTAAIDSAPESHNGRDSFKIRIAFSEPIGTSYRTLGRHFEVTDGRITDVRRVDKRSDLWQFTIDPSRRRGRHDDVAGGIDCTSTGAPYTSDGKTVAETISVTVPGPAEETTEAVLTGWFVDPPAEHDGTQFAVQIAFSEPIATSYRHIHHSVLGMNVEVNDVKRVDGRSDLWKVKATPTGVYGDVRLDLMGRRECGTPEDICTADGRPLSNTDTIIILAPAALSVADARGHENNDATIDFVVSLDRDALGTITVDYATRDGSATAGEDYTATSGTLTFEEGDREKDHTRAVARRRRGRGRGDIRAGALQRKRSPHRGRRRDRDHRELRSAPEGLDRTVRKDGREPSGRGGEQPALWGPERRTRSRSPDTPSTRRGRSRRTNASRPRPGRSGSTGNKPFAERPRLGP